MIAQAAVCLVVWLVVGWLIGRNPRWAKAGPKSPWAGVMLLIVATAIMLALMAGVVLAGGVKGEVMLPWAWAVTLVAGTVFVGGQTLGAVWTMTRLLERETVNPAPTSNQADSAESASAPSAPVDEGK